MIHLVVCRDIRLGLDVNSAFEIKQSQLMAVSAVEDVVHASVVNTNGHFSQNIDPTETLRLDVRSFSLRQSVPDPINLHTVSMLLRPSHAQKQVCNLVDDYSGHNHPTH